MIKFPFLIIFILLISCGSDINDNNLYLFGDTYIKLEVDEISNELTKENTDLYFSYVGNSDIQAPLYRYITNKDYQLFIGLPINTDFDTIKDKLKLVEIKEGKIDNISATYLYSNYTIESENITKFLVDVDNNLVLIIVVTKADKKLKAKELESLQNRFIKV